MHELFLEKLNIGISVGEIEKMARDHVITEGYQLVGHVGHSIGLKVEERPFLDATRSNPDYMIQEGMLFAFCQALVIRGRNHLGVRLEDTALVTKSGLEILTNYPRELLRIS